MRKLVLTALLFLPLGTLAAQSNPLELGVWLAGVSINSSNCSGCHSSTTIQVNPVGVGLAVYVSDRMAIEPNLAFTSISSHGSTSSAAIIGLGVPIYFDRGFGHSGLFAEPSIALNYAKFSGESSESQFGLGGAVGTKSRVSERISLRFAVRLMHYLRKDTNPSYDSIAALVGASLYLK